MIIMVIIMIGNKREPVYMGFRIDLFVVSTMLSQFTDRTFLSGIPLELWDSCIICAVNEVQEVCSSF